MVVKQTIWPSGIVVDPCQDSRYRYINCKTQAQSLSNIPEGMNRELLNVFEKYTLGDKSMLCLWRNGYLSCALRERSREQELQTRLSEWMNK